MDFIVDFIVQALPYTLIGIFAAMVGTFLGNRRK